MSKKMATVNLPVRRFLVLLAGLEERYHSGQQRLFIQQLVELVAVLPENGKKLLAIWF